MTALRTRRAAIRQTRQRLAGVETLEGRTLLTAGLTEFAGPFSVPVSIVSAPDGNLWVLNAAAKDQGSLVVIAPDHSVKATYTIPTANSGAMGLTVGPDGNLWFVEQNANQIAKVTPSGAITEYPVPTSMVDPGFGNGPVEVVAAPTAIVAGADGALYFTESSTEKIGRVTTDGVVTTIDAAGYQPQSIAVGSDHLVWFTDSKYDDSVDRVNADGTITSFALPSKFAWPTDLTLGPDGSLYFVEGFNQAIGKVTPAGVVTESKINAAVSSPQQLTFDKAGNLWITGSDAGLVRITPHGVATPFGPSSTAIGNLAAVTIGPDGAVWFTDTGRDQIGRIDPTTVAPAPSDHTLTLASVPDPSSWSMTTNSVSGDLATFYDSNPSGVAADFSATIAWGDGQTTLGAIRATDIGTFVISGDHAYAAPGAYSVTFNVNDTNPSHTPQPNSVSLTDQANVFDQPIATTIFDLRGGGPIASPGGSTAGGAPKTTVVPLVAKPKPTPKPVTFPNIRALVQLFEMNLLKATLARGKAMATHIAVKPVKPLGMVIPKYVPTITTHHPKSIGLTLGRAVWRHWSASPRHR